MSTPAAPAQPTAPADAPAEPPIRVMALHALAYCERLFYLEEVEEIRVADDRIWAGRRLHGEATPQDGPYANNQSGTRGRAGQTTPDDDLAPLRTYELSSEAWGLMGKLDAARQRDGAWVVYEHKRGRCRRGPKSPGQSRGPAEAWPTDSLQAAAYSVLLEEELNRRAGERGRPGAITIREARIRYHADNLTVRIAIDEAARAEVRDAVRRAQALRATTDRPPVAENERLCVRCSLKVVCLPEEERLAADSTGSSSPQPAGSSVGLPAQRDGRTLHVFTDGSRVARSGRSLVVHPPRHALDAGEAARRVPLEQCEAVVLHGHCQISTQALHACRYGEVAVHWITAGGRVVGSLAAPARVRQRLRQYAALTDANERSRLAAALVGCKIDLQLHYLLRATRGHADARKQAAASIDRLRECLRKVRRSAEAAATPDAAAPDAPNSDAPETDAPETDAPETDAPETALADSLRGWEGMAAKAYFAAFETMLSDRVDAGLRFSGRTRRPPRDRFSALLGYGYALVQACVERSILTVGLDPAIGFFHTPRTAAPPLVLDLMEPFRTLLWEMPLIGSLNRGQWDPTDDFELRPGHVWLSEAGRRKAIGLFEARLSETHSHPHATTSLEYARLVELEVRLLEKEWSGSPGLFGALRIR